MYMASISSPNTILPPSWLSESTNNTTPVKASHGPRVKKVADGEIDVFKADKYFNGVMVKESSAGSEKYQDHVRKNLTDKAATIAELSKLNLQTKTLSIHSESSYNSQSALLRRAQGNSARSKNNSSSKLLQQGKNSAFLSCYCCDKKSIELAEQDKLSEPGKRNTENDVLHERPIIRTVQTSLDAAEITRLNKLKKIQIDSQEESEEYRRKKSLEVFGSDEGSKRFSLEKRLNMLSWDAIPRSSETLSETCKDTESDASSDLFEIEGMTCSIQGSQKLSGDCTTRTSGYAPSEASIEWSVVTASVADCTGFPDSDEKRSSITSVTGGRTSMKPPLPVKTAVNKGGQKPRPGGMFAGCKSQKAIRVAEDVCRSPVIKRKPDESVKLHRYSESYSPVTRFQAEAKLPGNSLRQLKTTPSNDILYLY